MSEKDLRPFEADLKELLQRELQEKEAIQRRLRRQGWMLGAVAVVGVFLFAAIAYNIAFTNKAVEATVYNRRYVDTLKGEIIKNRRWTERLYGRGDSITVKLDALLRP